MEVSFVQSLHQLGLRSSQQDALAKGKRVFIVCDGVGGGTAGETASQFLAETLLAELDALPTHEPIDAEKINDAVQLAIERMNRFVEDHPDAATMATTLTLVAFNGERVCIAWCGDSRVYIFRNNHIHFRTTDHSHVTRLIEMGEITEEEARNHPQKNIITRSVQAGKPLPEIACHELALEEGDWWLQCTDGLLEYWTDDKLNNLFANPGDHPEQILAEFSAKHQTNDNHSAIMGQVGFTFQPPISTLSNQSSLPMNNDESRQINWALVLMVVALAAGIAAICWMYANKKMASRFPEPSPVVYFAPETP